MLESIYQNEHCNAKYDRTQKLLRTQYVGIVKVEAIIDLLRNVMEFSTKEDIKAMIANLTEMQGTFTGALEFFETEFYPTMIQNGLHSYAGAFSKDAFTKFAAEQLRRKVGGKLDWEAFSSVEDAEKWMERQMFMHSNPASNSRAS